MGKKVLVPSVLLGDAQAVLEGAGHELLFALPTELRAMGGTPEVLQARREAFDRGFPPLLAEAQALSAIGLGAQLAVTQQTLDAAPRLEVVFMPGAGVDSVDVAACTARGIAVVNAAGVNYASVAEHVVGLMLSLARWIALTDRAAHREQRTVPTRELGGLPGIVRGKTLGLVGFGFIGREVARMASTAFGMRVLAYDPWANATEAERLGVELVEDLHEVLGVSDVVSLHIPLTDDTRHLVGAAELALMKPTAVLLNTSRGGIVDTDALVRALQDRVVAGAGLDVTEPEPLPAGHPLFTLDNVILTPHSAGSAPEMTAKAGHVSAQDAVRALRGERPRNLVNPEVWPDFLARLEAAQVPA